MTNLYKNVNSYKSRKRSLDKKPTLLFIIYIFVDYMYNYIIFIIILEGVYFLKSIF